MNATIAIRWVTAISYLRLGPLVNESTKKNVKIGKLNLHTREFAKEDQADEDERGREDSVEEFEELKRGFRT